jgi:hypothetical protein
LVDTANECSVKALAELKVVHMRIGRVYSDDRSPHISDVSDVVIGVDASRDPSRARGRASEEPTTTDGFDSNSKIEELRSAYKKEIRVIILLISNAFLSKPKLIQFFLLNKMVRNMDMGGVTFKIQALIVLYISFVLSS